jgi:type IV pilus assembly protein PilV
MVINVIENKNGKQNGASFIEVLVALVILAVGLLGVLSMQARGLKSDQQAVFTTEATFLANDMANRIIAYDAPGNPFDGIDITSNGGCAAGLNAIVAGDCDGWVAGFVQSGLPAGRGTVEWDAVNSIYVISIRWDQERVGNLVAGTVAADCGDEATPDNDNPTLACYQLEVQP